MLPKTGLDILFYNIESCRRARTMGRCGRNATYAGWPDLGQRPVLHLVIVYCRGFSLCAGGERLGLFELNVVLCWIEVAFHH